MTGDFNAENLDRIRRAQKDAVGGYHGRDKHVQHMDPAVAAVLVDDVTFLDSNSPDTAFHGIDLYRSQFMTVEQPGAFGQEKRRIELYARFAQPLGSAYMLHMSIPYFRYLHQITGDSNAVAEIRYNWIKGDLKTGPFALETLTYNLGYWSHLAAAHGTLYADPLRYETGDILLKGLTSGSFNAGSGRLQRSFTADPGVEATGGGGVSEEFFELKKPSPGQYTGLHLFITGENDTEDPPNQALTPGDRYEATAEMWWRPQFLDYLTGYSYAWEDEGFLGL